MDITTLFHFDGFATAHFLALASLGALVGFTVGMTGVGGGSLMTPALIGLFGIAPSTAIGTDLAFAASTKSVGLVSLRNSGAIHWKLAQLMVIGSVAGALMSFLWLTQTQHSAHQANVHTGHVLRYAIAFALLLTAASLIFRERIANWARRSRPSLTTSRVSDTKRQIATLVLSFLIGGLVMLSSIGAGAIGCTVLTLLYPELDAKEISATDIAYAIPLTALSALMHGLSGHIDFTLLLALVVGSTPGVYLGVKAGRKISGAWSRGALATVLTLVAAKSLV